MKIIAVSASTSRSRRFPFPSIAAWGLALTLPLGTPLGRAVPLPSVAGYEDSPGSGRDHPTFRTSEREISLREARELRVYNPRGAVRIHGWSLDRVRVIARREEKPGEAVVPSLAPSAPPSAPYIRIKETARVLEVSVGLNPELSLAQRLRARSEEGRTSLEIWAPRRLSLWSWMDRDLTELHHWTGTAELRSFGGRVVANGIRSSQLSVFCRECALELSDSDTPLRVLGGSGNLDFRRVHSAQAFVESSAGAIDLREVSGEWLAVTDSGEVSVDQSQGRVEFRSRSGPVLARRVRGSLSGETRTGRIRAEIETWESGDKTYLSSETSDVSVALPHTFQGELEVHGASLDISPVFARWRRAPGGTRPLGLSRAQWRGSVGLGGEVLRISSLTGQVKVGLTGLTPSISP